MGDKRAEQDQVKEIYYGNGRLLRWTEGDTGANTNEMSRILALLNP